MSVANQERAHTGSKYPFLLAAAAIGACNTPTPEPPQEQAQRPLTEWCQPNGTFTADCEAQCNPSDPGFTGTSNPPTCDTWCTDSYGCSGTCGSMSYSCSDGSGGSSGGSSGGGGDPSGGGSSSLSWRGFQWANQSSTAHDGHPSKAIDGNPDGNFLNGSVTHTAQQTDPAWWGELEPGTMRAGVHMGWKLSKIRIANRTDCCSNRLEGADVLVHTNAIGNAHWIKIGTLSGTKQLYELSVPATLGAVHQVFIVKRGTNRILSVAEVWVLAWPYEP